jgi:hypothetical protein
MHTPDPQQAACSYSLPGVQWPLVAPARGLLCVKGECFLYIHEDA